MDTKKVFDLVSTIFKEWWRQIVSAIWALLVWFSSLPEKWRWGLIGVAIGAFAAFTLPKIWKMLKTKFSHPFPEIEDADEVFRLIGAKIKENNSDLAKASYRFWKSVAPRVSLLSKKDDPWSVLVDLMRVGYCFESIGVPDSEKSSFEKAMMNLEKRFKRNRGNFDGYDLPSQHS